MPWGRLGDSRPHVASRCSPQFAVLDRALELGPGGAARAHTAFIHSFPFILRARAPAHLPALPGARPRHPQPLQASPAFRSRRAVQAADGTRTRSSQGPRGPPPPSGQPRWEDTTAPTFKGKLPAQAAQAFSIRLGPPWSKVLPLAAVLPTPAPCRPLFPQSGAPPHRPSTHRPAGGAAPASPAPGQPGIPTPSPSSPQHSLSSPLSPTSRHPSHSIPPPPAPPPFIHSSLGPAPAISAHRPAKQHHQPAYPQPRHRQPDQWREARPRF